jgi:hypothetical protein
MALTREQKERLLEMLNELEEDEAEVILTTQQSLLDWLSDVAYDIYQAIQNVLYDAWEWVKDFFGV